MHVHYERDCQVIITRNWSLAMSAPGNILVFSRCQGVVKPVVCYSIWCLECLSFDGFMWVYRGLVFSPE